jgi:hypothetical protein
VDFPNSEPYINKKIKLIDKIDLIKEEIELTPPEHFSIDEKAYRCECVVASELE